MFNWNFAKKLFDGFTILRWTDFIRPTEFVQIEKSASQAILSYIIGKEYEEMTGKTLDWNYIVDSNVYGFLCKVATSDIKATIGNKIKKNNLSGLRNFIIDVFFDDKGKCKYSSNSLIDKNKLIKYINASKDLKEVNLVEYQICYIAHKFATYREFKYISNFNQLIPDKDRVENDISTMAIREQIKDQNLVSILTKLEETNNNLTLFYAYFEKLRPQIRWSQTCRIPQTTVLGHSMYVALLTYFAIKDLEVINNADKVLVDSFYAALFHDLPESLTRDIISPVKSKIKGLNTELSKYEYEEVNEKMIQRINDKNWKTDFLYLLGVQNGTFKYEFDREYVLGELIKSIDLTAAFVEAKMSVEFGINSEEIQKGIKNTSIKLRDKVFRYDSPDWRQSKNTLNFNEFLASIPQYKEGV